MSGHGVATSRDVWSTRVGRPEPSTATCAAAGPPSATTDRAVTVSLPDAAVMTRGAEPVMPAGMRTRSCTCDAISRAVSAKAPVRAVAVVAVTTRPWPALANALSAAPCDSSVRNATASSVTPDPKERTAFASVALLTVSPPSLRSSTRRSPLAPDAFTAASTPS